MNTVLSHEARDLIESIAGIDTQRDALNLQHYNDAPVTVDIADYAAAWGCPATFDGVDQSLEQRSESRLWQLAEELGVDWEAACATYHAQLQAVHEAIVDANYFAMLKQYEETGK